MKTERAHPSQVRTGIRWGWLVLSVLPALVGCYPYSSDEASDYDLVVTQFDKQANFYPATAPTYFMPEEVTHLVPPGDTDNISTAYDSLILSQVAENMADRQYTRVTDETIPTNFVVSVKATTSTYSYGYPYYGYGGYYYYYPYYVPYSYTTGTILIEMADPTQVEPVTLRVPVIWVCGINGLVSAGYPANRIIETINQCFNQSPYLGPS